MENHKKIKKNFILMMFIVSSFLTFNIVAQDGPDDGPTLKDSPGKDFATFYNQKNRFFSFMGCKDEDTMTCVIRNNPIIKL
jgi:hypothetical protein